MAANNRQITVTTTTPSPITASVYGALVTVAEDAGVPGWPTTDLLIFMGSSSGVPKQIPAGQSFAFQKSLNVPQVYFPGDTVGWVKAVTTTTTIDITEFGS